MLSIRKEYVYDKDWRLLASFLLSLFVMHDLETEGSIDCTRLNCWESLSNHLRPFWPPI